MADIRINALATTATTPASDDYLALDGTAQGTRKILATNIANNVTDVILGSSGPSVKSSLSARAPRQGLVFDGTGQATVANGQVIGTRDFTIAAWVLRSGSNLSVPIWGNAGSIGCAIRASTITLDKPGTGTVVTWNYTVASDKFVFVTIRRSGTTATAYVDGVSIGDVNSVGTDFTTVFSTVGLTTFSIGSIIGPYIYNRALSASEVVALYEAGAPAGADYNSASNTAFNTSNFVEAIAYTTFTGVSATGFSATQTGAVTSLVVTKPNITINAGNRVLVTFTGTLTSGAVPNVALVTSANGVASNISAVAAGSNSVVLTATAPCVGVGFYTTGAATSYAISNVVATRQGLLLAPDAAQAGGGLVWYDTSGNAANITLPASGVTWNVPSSLKLGGNWTVAGSFTNISTAQLAHTYTGAPANFNFGTFDTSGNASLNVQSNANLLFATFNTERARITASGNYLIGTTTDSANGKVQLATHTTSAGGIGFGSDTSLYRHTNGYLNIKCENAAQVGLLFHTNAAQVGGLGSDGTSFYFDAAKAGGSAIFRTNGTTTALTLDASQNATVVGTLTAKGRAIVDANGDSNARQFLSGTASSGAMITDLSTYAAFKSRGAGGVYLLDASNNQLIKAEATTGNTSILGSITTSAPTGGAGAWELGVANTVSPTAPNRTITIEIGGTVYYLHAKTTND